MDPRHPLKKAHAKLLAKDMNAWLADAGSSAAFAQEVEQMRSEIDRHTKSESSNRYKYEWISTLYIYFRNLAANPKSIGYSGSKWTLFPEVKPYRGEFLTDFSIWEDSYGVRIACESQSHEGARNKGRVEWALDKLLHVTADIKLLIFEESREDGNLIEALYRKYLTGYMHFKNDDVYLFCVWDGPAVRSYVWSPSDNCAPTIISQE